MPIKGSDTTPGRSVAVGVGANALLALASLGGLAGYGFSTEVAGALLAMQALLLFAAVFIVAFGMGWYTEPDPSKRPPLKLLAPIGVMLLGAAWSYEKIAGVAEMLVLGITLVVAIGRPGATREDRAMLIARVALGFVVVFGAATAFDLPSEVWRWKHAGEDAALAAAVSFTLLAIFETFYAQIARWAVGVLPAR